MADVCKIDKALIEQYLDGELGQADALKIQEHIEHCSDCTATATMFRLSSHLFKEHMEQATQQVDFSGFEQRVIEQLDMSERPGPKRSFLLWIQESMENHRAAWIGMAAAMAGALLMVLLAPWSSNPTPAHPPAGLVNPSPDSVHTARADNDIIIDQLEYKGEKSMIFTVSKNNTMVIWMYDFDTPGSMNSEGDEI